MCISIVLFNNNKLVGLTHVLADKSETQALILEDEREREKDSPGSLPNCSRRERSKAKHITQGVKLAFSDAKALEITMLLVSHIQGHLAVLLAM